MKWICHSHSILYYYQVVAGSGGKLDSEHAQLAYGHGGYDHCYVLDAAPPAGFGADRSQRGLKLAAKVTAPKSGVTMECLTQEPACQLYIGNFFDGESAGNPKGKGATEYKKHSAFCLETQVFPDSVNQEFGAGWREHAFLKPGEAYKTQTVYRFGVVA